MFLVGDEIFLIAYIAYYSILPDHASSTICLPTFLSTVYVSETVFGLHP